MTTNYIKLILKNLAISLNQNYFNNSFYFWEIIRNYIEKTSAVKWLIVINRIQNKSSCLHNICVYYCVYLLWIYK